MITLTDQELNVAIAKHLGWKFKGDPQFDGYTNGWQIPEAWVAPPGADLSTVSGASCALVSRNLLPDYSSDLNAMHEAEKGIPYEKRMNYHCTLADRAGFSYCEADTTEETNLDWQCHICHATARQRAEAFYLTVCKPTT